MSFDDDSYRRGVADALRDAALLCMAYSDRWAILRSVEATHRAAAARELAEQIWKSKT